MADPTQVHKIKCPYCGWVRSISLNVIEDASMTGAVRGGLGDALRGAVDKIRAALADARLDDANAWIDMPKCPHCGNVYRYNARTGEVAK